MLPRFLDGSFFLSTLLLVQIRRSGGVMDLYVYIIIHSIVFVLALQFIFSTTLINIVNPLVPNSKVVCAIKTIYSVFNQNTQNF